MRKTDDETIIRMLKEGKQQKEIAEHFGVSPAAICKRVKRICPPESLNNLTEKEKKFAIQVARGATKTNAALEAFDTKSPDSARALGNKLIKKPSVNAAIAELMDWHGLTRSYRVGRLKKHVDAQDPHVSLKALDQSWKLDGAYTEEKPEVVINHNEQLAILNIEDGKLKKRLLKIEAELAWIDEKISDKEFKDFLKELWDKKKDWELRDMYGWLLAKSGMSEAEIEAKKREFSGGMSGIYETGEGFGLE